MKTLFRILTVFLTISISGVVTSCRDDLDVSSSIHRDSVSTLVLYLPDADEAAEFGKTRADYQDQKSLADASEAKINSLWFFAYPVKKEGVDYEADTKRQSIITVLDETQKTETNTFSYTGYEIENFQEGDYRIYVLANVADYLPSESELLISGSLNTDIDEETLRKTILNFTTEKYLESGNLPMACLNTEIKDKENSASGVGEEGIFTFKKDSKEVWADLIFLCAKVRYTILFDNTADGFSKEFSKADVEVASPSVANVKQKYALTEDGEAGTETIQDFNKFAREHSRVEYPGEDSQFLKEDGPEESDTYYEADLRALEEEGSWVSDNQRAWQGTFYFPVNSTTDRTKLTFKATGTGVSADGYNIVLPSESGTLEKGQFYDVQARFVNSNTTQLDVKVAVKEWTPATVAAELLGPVTLVVENTLIEAKSGYWTIMGYDSNLRATFISPEIEIGGEKYDLFSIELIESGTTNEDGEEYEFTDDFANHLRLTINPEIPYSQLKGLQESSSLEEYKYFHIKVGNLMKKIEVDPVSIEPILDVTPLKITIDVRELTASGTNSLKIPISFITNIDITQSGYSFTLTGDTGIIPGMPSAMNAALWIDYKEGLMTSDASSVYTINSNQGELTLNIADILAGNTYWNNEYTYKLTFSLSDGNGLIKTDSGEPLERKVVIEVKPYLTDYVIHFLCTDPDYLWDNPHIYVYQCLELPANLTGRNADYAGKTLGYYYDKQGNEKEDNAVAALEYLFSNNVSFSGWEGYGGTNDPNLNDISYPNMGFAMYTYNGKRDNANCGLNPENFSDYYIYDQNLNTAHQKGQSNWTCDICGDYREAKDYSSEDLSPDRGGAFFTGVSMEREHGENEGWVKYTLTGLATPGKCLIIFFNGHNWKDLPGNNDAAKTDNEPHYRFPCKDKGQDTAGVPLFDFPDNEGWFVFDGDGQANRTQNFRNIKPDDIVTLKSTDKIRFEWPANYISGSMATNLHVVRGNYSTDWPGIAGTYDSATGRYYTEVNVTDFNDYDKWILGANALKIMFNSNDGKRSTPILINFNDFKNTYRNHTYTISLQGTGEEVVNDNKFHKGDVLNISWWSEYSGRYYVNIYAEGIPTTSYHPFGDWGGTMVSDWNTSQRNYQSFTFDRDETGIFLQLHKNYERDNEIVKYNIYPSSVDYIEGKGGKDPNIRVTDHGHYKEYSVTLWEEHKHYLYFQDQDDKFSSTTPMAYMYTGATNNGWGSNATKMSPCDVPEGATSTHGSWYRIEIPVGFEQATFIINMNSDDPPRSDKGSNNISGAKLTAGYNTVVYYYDNPGGTGWGYYTVGD